MKGYSRDLSDVERAVMEANEEEERAEAPVAAKAAHDRFFGFAGDASGNPRFIEGKPPMAPL